MMEVQRVVDLSTAASSRMRMTVGDIVLWGTLEEQLAPATCAAFRRLLPLTATVLHVRWSGESTWVPLGDLSLGIGPENAIHRPTPGQILFYPGGVSETEILIPYGQTAFAAKTGALSGNHFLTITGDRSALAEIGRRALWEGAQKVTFALENPDGS
jgi:Protein of unknown function (DUF3830)